MAEKKTRKTSEAFNRPPKPKIEGPTRTELRQQDQEEIQQDMDDTRNRMDNFFAEKDGRGLVDPPPPDDVTNDSIKPAPSTSGNPQGGGDQTPPPSQDNKPPIAQVTEEATEPENLEQFDAKMAEIRAPKGQEENVRGIKQNWRKEFERRLARDTEVAELKIKLAEAEGKITPPEEIERLRTMEKIVHRKLVKDLPKWQQYDAEVEGTNKEIEDFLKSFQVPQATLDAIKKRSGRVSAIAVSHDPAGSAHKNPDGTPMTSAQWFEHNIVEKFKLTQADKMKLFGMIQKAEDRASAKSKDMEAAETDAAATIQKEKQDWETQIIPVMEKSMRETMRKELPRMNFPLEPPKVLATDSKEEAAKKQEMIRAWDKGDKEVKDLVPALVRALPPEKAAEFAFKLAFYEVALSGREKDQKTIADLQKKVDELQTFHDSVKGARKLPKTPAPVTPTEVKKDLTQTSAEERVQAWAAGKA